MDHAIHAPHCLPPLNHESRPDGRILDIEAEEEILRGSRPLVLALASSLGDGYEVPRRGAAAATLIAGAIVGHLGCRMTVPYAPDIPESKLRDVWEDLRFTLTESGERLPVEVQKMVLWMYMPHQVCSVAGSHGTANHFCHVWDSLFTDDPGGVLMQRLPHPMVEAGDMARDRMPHDVRLCIALVAQRARGLCGHLQA